MTANEELYDASLRHQVAIRRLASGDVNSMIALLDKADKELAHKLLDTVPDGAKFTKQRMQAIATDIKALRSKLKEAVVSKSKDGLTQLSFAEQEFAKQALEKAMPVAMDFASVSATQLEAIVNSQPFAGGPNSARTLDQWWNGVFAGDQQRIMDAVQLGLLQAETNEQIARRIGQATDLTRRQAEAVARTATNHVSNAARESFFSQNKDVMSALRWTATLDGRTSLICAGRDGHVAPIDIEAGFGGLEVTAPKLDPPTARPPAHPQCRSTMIAMLDPNGVADGMPDRAFVKDTRTRRKRERDFRAEAKERAGAKWKGMTPRQRNRMVKNAKRRWAKDAIGHVPPNTTYDEWLRKQPKPFQDNVLGVKRAQAFRKGAKVDQFTDKRGAVLNLKELKQRYPEYLEGTAPKPKPKPVALPVPKQPIKPAKPEAKIIDHGDKSFSDLYDTHWDMREKWDVEAGVGFDKKLSLTKYTDDPSLYNKDWEWKNNSDVSNVIGDVDDVFAKTKAIGSDMAVYNSGVYSPGEFQMLFGNSLEKGSSFKRFSFVDGSLSRDVYNVSHVANSQSRIVNMRIVVDGKDKVIPFRDIKDQRKVLLDRSAKYEITSVKQTGTRKVKDVFGDDIEVPVHEIEVKKSIPATKPRVRPEAPKTSATPAAPGEVDFGDEDRYDFMHNTFTAMWEDWTKRSPRVTTSQRISLSTYQGSSYRAINSSLRNPGNISGFEDHIKNIDDVFSSTGAVLKETTYTYRAANFSASKAKKVFGPEGPKVGAVFSDKGYVSTSMTKKIYNTGLGGSGQTRIRARIKVAKGTRVVVMRPAGQEYEVLLNRGSTFRITRVEQIKDEFHIDVELLPEGS